MGANAPTRIPIQANVVAIAAAVIQQADRQHPADAVLRAELKRQRGLGPATARAISRAVFAYYRWLGWLDQQQPLSRQLADVEQLQERFSRDPGSFSDEDLLGRAVPPWALRGDAAIEPVGTRSTASLESSRLQSGRRWNASLPEPAEVTSAWVRALQSEPRLWLRARKGQGRELAQTLGDCRPAGDGALADTLEYQGEKDLFRTPELHAGAFEVQDLSSQVVGLICDPKPAETWWDACAGEGGKTLHLSDLMQNQGLIWASDRAAWRLQRLKRRAARARVFNYRAAVWNGGAALPTKTRFDGVLIDAPCSGLGTWQRNPHARWTTTPADVLELGDVQRRLLAHAAAALKPGGRLIYSVCTLTRAETIEVVAAFVRQFPDLRPLPIMNPLTAGTPEAKPLWIWPQTHGGAGMFIAGWQK